MTDISVLIVAKDDTRYLLQCIESVSSWAYEVIIINIGIPNEFVNQLKKLKIQIIPYSGDVKYADQIRDNVTKYATSEYVYFLDPDEIIPKDLQSYIIDNYQKYDAICFPRKNIIFGKWIQYSRWWPDHQLRLYKKSKGIWKAEIHSKPQIQGSIHEIPAKESLAIIHHNYRNIDQYFAKMIRYAKAEAQDYAMNNRNISLSEALSKGTQEFISRFFAGDGYKDGMHGFTLSFLQSIYYPVVYFYYWEEKKYSEIDQKEIVKSIEKNFIHSFIQTAFWIRAKKLKSSLSYFTYKIVTFLLL